MTERILESGTRPARPPDQPGSHRRSHRFRHASRAGPPRRPSPSPAPRLFLPGSSTVRRSPGSRKGKLSTAPPRDDPAGGERPPADRRACRRSSGWTAGCCARRSAPLEGDEMARMFRPHLGGRARPDLDERGSPTFRLRISPGRELDEGSGPSWRFRVNVHRQRGQLAAAIRAAPPGDPDPREPQPAAAPSASWCAPSRGLVLVCGPTGSGKSTTLAALVDEINRTRAGHIITIEDPIEYEHRSSRSVIEHIEVGRDAALLPRRPARRAAAGPGRHPGRRDARPGDRRDRPHRRRDRPPGALDPPHQRRAAGRAPHRRRLPAGPAGPDPPPARPRPARHRRADSSSPAPTAAAGSPRSSCCSPTTPCATTSAATTCRSSTTRSPSASGRA